jgi:hypothetical protein
MGVARQLPSFLAPTSAAPAKRRQKKGLNCNVRRTCEASTIDSLRPEGGGWLDGLMCAVTVLTESCLGSGVAVALDVAVEVVVDVSPLLPSRRSG